MIGSLRVITGPKAEPLTVAELHKHSRIGEDGGEEFLLESYLSAVRIGAEKILDLAFLTQTLEWAIDAFPVVDFCDGYEDTWAAIELPRPPLQSVTSITYVDTAGATQTLSASLYLVDTRSTPGRIIPAYGQSWPAIRYQPSAVVVRYVAGINDPADVPEDQKQMLRLAVGTLNEYRESVLEGSAASMGILEQFFAPYRNALAV